jgi:aspartyl-tRNA synthetase
MKDWKRTHSCGELRESDVGKQVTLMGWVARVRDLGGITFLDLRDRAGITQILVRVDAGTDVVEAAKGVGSEWVVATRGTVVERETANPDLPTGEIEVNASGFQVLSESKVPPFLPADEGVSEETRLRYRYLDLRRPILLKSLAIRSRLAMATRKYMDSRGFYEIETPILTKSTPEGARDYLVPSRVNNGAFYALPQSPQLFKQLLMISGVERYFQIPRCFRDEDLRADRQPEFTQVDIEMSFVDQDDVFEVVEGLFAAMLEVIDVEIQTPFPRMKFDEAMDRFGSDKPDLRFGVEIADVSELFTGSGYGVFERVVSEGGAVRSIAASGCAGYSRKDIDGLEKLAKAEGAKGLAWARWTDSGIQSPLAKHVGESRLEEVFRRAGGSPGDLLLIVAAFPRKASVVLGALRLELARRESWAKEGDWRFVWVTDFPLLEYSETEKRWTSMHHPFTSPNPEDIDRLESDPGSVRAVAYDVVANGHEVGGGSIRIHRADIQSRIFKVLQLTEEEAREKFGFFLDALQYGTPPHGGIALGFDRIAMLAAGGKSLRDVIAFPKTTSALDLMTGSPSRVTGEQLDELGLRLAKKAEKVPE